MGDFFMEETIELLNTMYQNAEMGIIGIEDVIYKIRNSKLLKELENEKKEYHKILKTVKKLLKEVNGKQKPVNMWAKISSSIYSEMKLMNKENDQIIIKMMIEGTYKSIGILTTKEIEDANVSDDVKDVLDIFIKTLKNNIQSLKNIDALLR